MSKSVSFGFTAASETKNVARPVLSKADYAVISDDSSSECIMTNLSAPTDQPETFRWAYRPIKNIYSGSNIEPSLYSTSKAGVSILAELREVGKVTDSTDTGYRIDYPVRVRTVIEVPLDGTITDDQISDLVKRHLSLLYTDATSTASRISELRHYAMQPTQLG